MLTTIVQINCFLGWPQFKNKQKNIMFNLTGMINTDLLLLDIINAYFLNKKIGFKKHF